MEELGQSQNVDIIIIVKVTPPLLVRPQEILELLLHLAAERQTVMRGGTVGHDQMVASPGHQLRVAGVGVGEEPGVVPDQTDPCLQEDDQPGVVVLLSGLNADVDLLKDAGQTGLQMALTHTDWRLQSEAKKEY